MCGPVGPMMYAENASGVTSGEFSQKGRPIAVGRSFAILTSLFAFLNAAPPSVTVRLILISFVLPSHLSVCAARHNNIVIGGGSEPPTHTPEAPPTQPLGSNTVVRKGRLPSHRTCVLRTLEGRPAAPSVRWRISGATLAACRLAWYASGVSPNSAAI